MRSSTAVVLVPLEQVIDTTFGRSSTPHTATRSVKFRIAGGPESPRLHATFQTVVNFCTQQERVALRGRCSDEALSAIDLEIKRVKSEYRERAASALKLREIGTSDSLEMVGASPHNPKKTAIYRREVVFEIC